MHIKLKIQVAI